MLNSSVRKLRRIAIIIISIFTLSTLIYLTYFNGSKVTYWKELKAGLSNEFVPAREILPTIQYQNISQSPVPKTQALVQKTKKIPPIAKPTNIPPEKSPWLEYRSNWSEQDSLVDIDDNTGILTFLPEYRPKMLTKRYHPLTRKYFPFKKRIDIMNKFCAELNVSSTGSMMLFDVNRMYFNDRYESIYCAIPKTSSRIWVRIYAQMHNAKREWELEPPPNERKIISLGYHMIPHNFTAKRIQTYTKTLVIRHPFKRLISGFNDKFSHHTLYVNGINKDIIAKLYLTGMPLNESDFIAGMNTDYSYLDTNTKMNIMLQYMRLKDPYLKLITLIEFLKYLIITWEEEGSTKSFDPHWRPISDYCLPCSFSFDILIEHEKVAEESQLVLDYLQSNNKLNPPHKFDPFRPQTSLDVCNKAFNTISLDIREKIFEIYKYDFALFGYKTNLTSDNNIC